jgi:hypothetical protein
MVGKEEFLIWLAERLKISDMYGLSKAWISMSKSEDAIEKLVQSDEFTVEEKIFLSVNLGLETYPLLKR